MALGQRQTTGGRRAEVTTADREAEVFNLILGKPTSFVAGDFVVRSKPPAVPARGRSPHVRTKQARPVGSLPPSKPPIGPAPPRRRTRYRTDRQSLADTADRLNSELGFLSLSCSEAQFDRKVWGDCGAMRRLTARATTSLPNQGAAETRQIRFGYGAVPRRVRRRHHHRDQHAAQPAQPPHHQQRHPRPDRQRAQRPEPDRLGLPVGPVHHPRHRPDPQRADSSTRSFARRRGRFPHPRPRPERPVRPEPDPVQPLASSTPRPARRPTASSPGHSRVIVNGREAVNSITSYIDAFVVYGSAGRMGLRN